MRTPGKTDIENTFSILLLIDYTKSNPNGDFNAGGHPRQDPISGTATVSRESLNRKLRDYVYRHYGHQEGFDTLIRSGDGLQREDGENLTLDDLIQRCRKDAGLGKSKSYEEERKTGKKKKTKKPLSGEQARNLRNAVLSNCYDARTLGALLSVGSDPVEGVKGPFVTTDGESVHPVIDMYDSNTRQMVTRESEKKDREKTVGSHVVLRYALVQHMIEVSPNAARISGMTMEDLYIALEALINCWSEDTAAHRRGVFRGIWIFKQPAKPRRPVPHDWTDVVSVKCNLENHEEASSFSDFSVVIRPELLPRGVEILDTEAVIDMIGLHEDSAA